MVEPIDAAQEQEVIAETRRYIDLAAELLGRGFDYIPVHFDLRGEAAGMFRAEPRQCWIRYNPWIFGKYYLENLADTVPHEVAHYIVHQLYPRRRVKPHGTEWQALMEAFGANPRATFRLDLEGIPRRRQRTHAYRCDCREHAVSSTRHNRMLRGKGDYLCRYCNARLVYAGA